MGDDMQAAARHVARTELTPSVLVVDDSTDTRLIARLVLESAGFGVTEAGDGGAALDLLADGQRPDLILLDLRMPLVDGFEVMEALANSPHHDVPVVLFTSHMEDVDRGRLPSRLRPPVVIKPFLAERLVEVVNAVMQLRSEAP